MNKSVTAVNLNSVPQEPSVCAMLNNSEDFLTEAQNLIDDILYGLKGGAPSNKDPVADKGGLESSSARISCKSASVVGGLKDIRNKLYGEQE